MSELQLLDKDTWESFYQEGVYVLVVGKTTCQACQEWGAELAEFLTTDHPFPNVKFGKIMINTGGLSKWKKQSPWLADVTDLPCTVILRNGEIQKQFYGKGVERLSNRLQKVVDAAGCCGGK